MPPRSDVRGLTLGLALCVAHRLVCAEEDEHGVVAVWAAVRECAHSVRNAFCGANSVGQKDAFVIGFFRRQVFMLVCTGGE